MKDLIKDLMPVNWGEVILRAVGIYALVLSALILLNIASLNKIGQLGTTLIAAMIGLFSKYEKNKK